MKKGEQGNSVMARSRRAAGAVGGGGLQVEGQKIADAAFGGVTFMGPRFCSRQSRNEVSRSPKTSR